MSKKDVEQGLKITKRSLKQLERDMLREYKITLKNIRNDILKLSGKVNEFTTSELVKYNRLKSLKKNITAEIVKLNKKTGPMINRERIQTAKIGFAANTEDLIVFTKVNRAAIKAALQFPLSGQPFAKTMQDLTLDTIKRIDAQITQGLVQGKGIRKVAKGIADSMGISYRRSQTIARTETLRALSIGQLEATDTLEKRGFTVDKIWLYSFHVKGSRIMHENKNGKSADKEGWFNFPDGVRMQAPKTSGVASHDINCRCTYYNEIKE